MTLYIIDDATGAKVAVPEQHANAVLNALDGRAQPVRVEQKQASGPGNQLLKGSEEKLFEALGLTDNTRVPERVKDLLWACSPEEDTGKISTETEERVRSLEHENMIRGVYLSNRATHINHSDLEQAQYVWDRSLRRARTWDGRPNLLELLTETHIRQRNENLPSARSPGILDTIKTVFRGGDNGL